MKVTLHVSYYVNLLLCTQIVVLKVWLFFLKIVCSM